MGKLSRGTPSTPALKRLRGFQRDWESVEIRRGDVRVAEGFATARAKAIATAADLFIGGFGPIAARALQELGLTDCFDIPDPPDVVGLPEYDPMRVGRLAMVLTGSPDTREGGRRVLWWAVAAHDPTSCFSLAVRLWTRALIHPLNDEGDWRLLRQPIQWAVDFVTAYSNHEPPLLGPAHSADYRSVNWFGKEYSFTPIQAACIKLLWENWEQGTPDVGGQTLLESADASQSRFDLVFRDHPAWRNMIVAGRTKGTYRLQDPQAASAERRRKPAATAKRRTKKSSRAAKKRA